MMQLPVLRSTDLNDAIYRLDKLTDEEARMAIVQNLKVTHTVDETVRGVADTVVAIDNRVLDVTGVDPGVDGQLTKVKR